ncbi:MAG TPA: amylo-alpha-1,6-glucosidase, partial [Polyangiaceae bacterium]|nr:amylo-alpha-1,6-glucosidase [Polyangiaceae bacterium]
LLHTRRSHGALVAALDPPLGRHVIISHAETTVHVEADKRTYRLATHQFPNVAPTLGYKLIEYFAVDPIPRWMFRLGGHTLERTLCLARGKNAVVLSYTWYGRTPCSIAIRPLMPLRPVQGLMTEHGGMRQVVTLRPGAVELQPVTALPPIHFLHEGVFMGSPDWWRRFEYLGDRADGLAFHEDMWTPGVFEISLEPGKTVHLLTAVGKVPEQKPDTIVAETRDFLSSQDLAGKRSPTVRILGIAAEQFLVESDGQARVLAGYPWHAVHTRDIVIALPGLLLSRGRIDDAVRVTRSLIRHLHAGLLPELLDPRGPRRARPLPDATLWLFEVARLLMPLLGPREPFLERELYPALVRAFARLRSRRRRLVWRSNDGLLVTSERGVALTWMDSHVADGPVTQRAGIAIEHQALYARACDTVARLASLFGQDGIASAAGEAALSARSAFRARFWCADTEYPYDCVSEARDRAEAWADATVRPNALIALAVDPTLFEGWQAEAILQRVQGELLTPNGVRSLAPDDPRYHGHFGANGSEREASYHQGTCWTHLLGFYARAARQRWGDETQTRDELVRLLERAVDQGPLLGQLAQLCDGDAPHKPRGSPAQATAVAEVLRALVELGQ